MELTAKPQGNEMLQEMCEEVGWEVDGRPAGEARGQAELQLSPLQMEHMQMSREHRMGSLAAPGSDGLSSFYDVLWGCWCWGHGVAVSCAVTSAGRAWEGTMCWQSCDSPALFHLSDLLLFFL